MQYRQRPLTAESSASETDVSLPEMHAFQLIAVKSEAADMDHVPAVFRQRFRLTNFIAHITPQQMKLTDKRIFVFEVMMLLCGVTSTFVEALAYGVNLFFLIGHFIFFLLCYCIGGMITWKIAKSNAYWLLTGYSLLFSVLTFCLYILIHYPIYGIPITSTTYWSAILGFALCSILPLLLCCYGYKLIEKHLTKKYHKN